VSRVEFQWEFVKRGKLSDWYLTQTNVTYKTLNSHTSILSILPGITEMIDWAILNIEPGITEMIDWAILGYHTKK
jgi:hypothetical protein